MVLKRFQYRKIITLLRTAFKKWISRDPLRESAIIAYSAIFSLPGLLVVVVNFAAYFFGADAVNGTLHDQIAAAMGNSTADQVQQMVVMATKSRDSLWATIIGIATILIGATAVFVELQKSLDIIWEVKARSTKSGIWALLKTRLFSYGIIVTIAFLLLISMVISAILAAINDRIMQHGAESMLFFFPLFTYIFSLATVTILFAMVFKILPDAKIKWSLVWIGAFVTALLFEIGKTALGFFFNRVDAGSQYGAAGSIVLVLLWTSYSSMIVFYGAEFTKAYSDLYYGDVPASEIAVKEPGRIV